MKGTPIFSNEQYAFDPKRSSSDYEIRGDLSLIFATSRDGLVDLPARANHPVEGLKRRPLPNPSMLP